MATPINAIKFIRREVDPIRAPLSRKKHLLNKPGRLHILPDNLPEATLPFDRLHTRTALGGLAKVMYPGEKNGEYEVNTLGVPTIDYRQGGAGISQQDIKDAFARIYRAIGTGKFNEIFLPVMYQNTSTPAFGGGVAQPLSPQMMGWIKAEVSKLEQFCQNPQRAHVPPEYQKDFIAGQNNPNIFKPNNQPAIRPAGKSHSERPATDSSERPESETHPESQKWSETSSEGGGKLASTAEKTSIPSSLLHLCEQNNWEIQGEGKIKKVILKDKKTEFTVSPQEVFFNKCNDFKALALTLKALHGPGASVMLFHKDEETLQTMIQHCRAVGLQVDPKNTFTKKSEYDVALNPEMQQQASTEQQATPKK